MIAECGTSICATNIWIRDPDKQREHVGDRLVFKISHNGDSWTGTAYDPKRDPSRTRQVNPPLHCSGCHR